jgi:hypothetical protein
MYILSIKFDLDINFNNLLRVINDANIKILDNVIYPLYKELVLVFENKEEWKYFNDLVFDKIKKSDKINEWKLEIIDKDENFDDDDYDTDLDIDDGPELFPEYID